ncbi:MAG TPA: hypothetical protein VIF09_09255 [Polyangiaceae bacterium]
MRTRVDDRLRDEARRFALRFACDDCAHFDPARARCSLGYPAAPRRDALTRAEVELCKSFELA